MICTDCGIKRVSWEGMFYHYKIHHPDCKNPAQLFTKEARSK